MDSDSRFIRELFPAAASGPAIVCVSAGAWSQGVRPGMPLAEARSMAQPLTLPSRPGNRVQPGKQPVKPAVEFSEWQPQHDRAQLQLVAEQTRRYAPVVGLDVMPLPDSLLLDITGCGPLFGGEAALAELLLRDLRLAGWQCRIAIAQTVSAVWAFTHIEAKPATKEPLRRKGHSGSRVDIDLHQLPIQIIPPGQHLAELSGLPVSVARLSLKDLTVLGHLGIRSIQQLLSLPLQDLPSRLSAEAVTRIQHLSEVMEETIEPLPEANPVSASWSAEEPARSLADIRHVCQHLVEQIAAQLVRRRLACSSVAVLLKCANGVVLPLTAGVVKPTQSADLLFEVLCLRLETQVQEAEESAARCASAPDVSPRTSETDGTDRNDVRPPSFAILASEAVVSVTMTATLVPIPSTRQKDLFSPTEHIVPQEELALLVTRLSNRLGPEAVLSVGTAADPRPEFAIMTHPVLPSQLTHSAQARLSATMERLAEPEPPVNSPSETTIERSGMERPLRLLPVPQLITTAVSQNGFPSSVMVLGKTLSLVHFAGPERIQTAWWTDQPCHRDYYQAVATSGNRLWIFRDLHTNRWSLHGVFD